MKAQTSTRQVERPMTNYKLVNSGQGYGTIGKELDLQFEQNPTHEIRFKRVPNTQTQYSAHALLPGKEPEELNRMRVMDVTNKRDLRSILAEAKIESAGLPDEIRVIQLNWGKDIWGIFYSSK
ncbi:MAG: hypothetical protein EPN88_17535 [Bacteroidetes bacterium]|nr:MAG: hypothetical protein EPN88_17535 [Bacteroidota bacterium]